MSRAVRFASLLAWGLVSCSPRAAIPRPPEVQRVAAPAVAPEPAPAAAPESPAAPVPAPAETPPAPALDPVSQAAVLEAKVAALLSGMTLEQKVGQLMMVGFSGTYVDESITQLVRGRAVGGVCLFKRNIEGAEQVARLNDQLRALMADQVPPFIAVDQEGGNVVRVLDGAVVLPGNMALGATGTPELAYEAGKAQAEDLLRLGFNMNLAPVLDVNVNPKNPVIGIRSFGDRPGEVARFGADYIRGQQDGNLVTVAKHFPGHGNTDADSHRALPVMQETQEELVDQLRPFAAAIGEGLDGLMTAHVAVPSVTGSDVPATVSRTLLTGWLRQRLGFNGLVVTDELEMEAIAARYGVGKAAVLAIQAGADMVLVPWHPEKKTEVYEALLSAARSGQLTSADLDAAVRRILTVKVRRHLFEQPLPLLTRMAQLRGRDQDEIAKLIAQKSVTLLRTAPELFPLRHDQKIAVLTAEGSLGKAIWRRAPDANVLVVPAYPSEERRTQLRERARELIRRAKVVVVGVINSRQLDLVALAAASGKPVVVVSMGLPYLTGQVEDAKAVLAVYSYRPVSAEAAAAALFGERGTPGKLPVDLGRFKFGHGLDPVGDSAKRAAIETSAAVQ